MPETVFNSPIHSLSVRFHRIYSLLREAVRGFQRHKVPRLGAALAFYTLLSLSPLLVIVLAVLGSIFGTEAAHGSLSAQIEGLVGHDAATAIQSMLSNAGKSSNGWPATLIGSAILIFGASGVFVELKESLDTIWETPPQPSRGWGLRSLALDRILAFAAIFGLAILMLASLLFSAFLTAAGDRFARYTSLEIYNASLINSAVSFLLIVGLFAMIFRLLPTIRPAWSRVWFGALVTALLFLAGKSLIGLYIGRAAVGSAYGAAGSLVVLLVWIYYSTQIVLFGAELTRASVKAPTESGPPTGK